MIGPFLPVTFDLSGSSCLRPEDIARSLPIAQITQITQITQIIQIIQITQITQITQIAKITQITQTTQITYRACSLFVYIKIRLELLIDSEIKQSTYHLR